MSRIFGEMRQIAFVVAISKKRSTIGRARSASAPSS